MMNYIKKYFLLVALLIIFISVIARIPDSKKEEEQPRSKSYVYEQQLFTDKNLQQKVEAFSLPENILEMFQQNKEQLQAFADQCYNDRKKAEIFFVEYIDDKRFYFCWSDIPGSIYGSTIEEGMAIQTGSYEHITAFFDYAINNDLVFRDWMLEIITPNPVNEDRIREKEYHGALLTITIYDGWGLNVQFLYSPYEDVDYSEEYEGPIQGAPGCNKIVRIDSHWYYQYVIMKGTYSWWPDPKTLGFSEKGVKEEVDLEMEEVDLEMEEVEYRYMKRLTPVQVALIYAVKYGVPIIAVTLIFILIRHYIRRKKK